MEKKPPLVMTPFDESLTNDFLQLVKIILPYLPDHVQRIAGIYVKLTELMNAFYCFQPPYYHNRRGRLRKQEKDPGSKKRNVRFLFRNMANDGNDERDGLWRSCKYGRYDEWISGSTGYDGYDEWISDRKDG